MRELGLGAGGRAGGGHRPGRSPGSGGRGCRTRGGGAVAAAAGGAPPAGARGGAGRGGRSPAADVLAVIAGNRVQLVSPSGQARTLVRAPGLESAAWSPDGSALVVATGSPSASTLVSYPVADGRPANWLHLSAHSSMNNTI